MPRVHSEIWLLTGFLISIFAVPSKYGVSMRSQGGHSAKIEAAIARDEAAKLPLVASWQRSSSLHKLDPEKRLPPNRLTMQELNEAQERMGLLLATSASGLDQLYLAVGDVGCSVILADQNGVAMARRGASQDDKTFDAWGLWTGTVWSEESEGTNGVGTCIVEKRPLTIHKDQHFRSKNTELSCIAAPIFDHEGELLAVIDVSSCRADLTAGFSRLISAAVVDAARRIETAHFSECFAGARILLAAAEAGGEALHEPQSGAALIAVDSDDLVIGATRSARSIFGLSKESLQEPKPLASLSGQNVDQAREYLLADKRVILQAMASCGGNVSSAARSLGISRATLHRKLKKFKISQ